MGFVMALRPLFSFFGSKWRIARHYPAPTYGTIVEPYAGSAGYSLRYPSSRVILVERDPTIASVWRYLLRATEEEVLSLPDLADGQTTADLDLPDGARALIGFWLNRSTTQPAKSPSAWMRSGKHTTSFWGATKRARIAQSLSHIRHWTLVEGDALAFMDANAALEATWFVDPPYADKGRYYRWSDVDHAEVAERCRNRRGQVIVCEQDGANWLPFKHLVNAKANNATKTSAEAVWTSDEMALRPLRKERDEVSDD